ncbi:uncharacterized protein LOC124135256 [Haliotis rufescens]|uniref:uncharacterized protein LOC124135256 n=1 Tax=Haliotis rufescens TaxID=6454 RepID=UPI00201F9138|nr:uncharacterized protein LOC124135256 [Haliotis rufescens]
MDLVEKPGWKHSDISQWPKELMGPCADHACPPGRRCSVHRVTKAVMCTEVGVYVCSEAHVPNATCIYGSKLIGGTRSCTCQSNYLDVPRDVLNVNNTCMKNGSWSTPSVNCSGPYVKVYSPFLNTYTFQQIPASRLRKITGGTSSIVFLVKACHDANIALHTRPNTTDTDAYEIIVGGWTNTFSCIRRCFFCPLIDSYKESSILSCHEYRPFWLSWKKDVISVGKGQIVGHQTFIESAPSSPIVINHVSVSAFKRNHAMWLFREQ